MAAIGAGVSLNEIDANVTDTQATSGNSVRVTASSDSSIEALAAGVQAGALPSGSVGTNEVQSVEALVTRSDVTAANDVDVSALNASGIRTVSGGLAGSGAAAIGAGISLTKSNPMCMPA